MSASDIMDNLWGIETFSRGDSPSLAPEQEDVVLHDAVLLQSLFLVGKLAAIV